MQATACRNTNEAWGFATRWNRDTSIGQNKSGYLRTMTGGVTHSNCPTPILGNDPQRSVDIESRHKIMNVANAITIGTRSNVIRKPH